MGFYWPASKVLFVLVRTRVYILPLKLYSRAYGNLPRALGSRSKTREIRVSRSLFSRFVTSIILWTLLARDYAVFTAAH